MAKSAKACEIIAGKLYFASLVGDPADTADTHYFTADKILHYEPFFADFGPLNLACLYHFCRAVNHKLQDASLKEKKIVYYCGPQPEFKANAATLIGCYAVIYLDLSAEAAYKLLAPLEPFMPFRDAGYGACTFDLGVRHCLSGIQKAHKLKWFDFNTFNADEYEHFEQVENGDLNIVLPGKFLAFASPANTKYTPDGFPCFTPDDYAPIFKRFGVSTVIRLNKKVYDHRMFTKHGIRFYDMYFVDGTNPSFELLDKFIEIAEQTKEVIAVHCKAGLGRTGTCIGGFIMKHYGLTAEETIAWLRVARPGSVVGPQQEFLKEIEPRMWRAGKQFRAAKEGAESKLVVSASPAAAATVSVASAAGLSAEALKAAQSMVPIQPRKGRNTDGGLEDGAVKELTTTVTSSTTVTEGDETIAPGVSAHVTSTHTVHRSAMESEVVLATPAKTKSDLEPPTPSSMPTPAGAKYSPKKTEREQEQARLSEKENKPHTTKLSTVEEVSTTSTIVEGPLSGELSRLQVDSTTTVTSTTSSSASATSYTTTITTTTTKHAEEAADGHKPADPDSARSRVTVARRLNLSSTTPDLIVL